MRKLFPLKQIDILGIDLENLELLSQLIINNLQG